MQGTETKNKETAGTFVWLCETKLAQNTNIFIHFISYSSILKQQNKEIKQIEKTMLSWMSLLTSDLEEEKTHTEIK